VGSGYYLFIVLVGFKLGSLAFMAAFVAVEANVRWYKMLALLLGTIIILEIFHKFLNVFWPLDFWGFFGRICTLDVLRYVRQPGGAERSREAKKLHDDWAREMTLK
jgi:hypothetical protein